MGRRNYTHFFALIFVAVRLILLCLTPRSVLLISRILQTLTLCLVIVTSALHLSMLTHESEVKTFSHALGKGVGSAVAFCLAATVIWPVGALLVYHVRVSDRFLFSVDRKRNSPTGISFCVLTLPR